MKSLDDGDGASIQYAYNSRLAPSSYTISDLYGGGSMSWNYTYHPDGNVRFAADMAENDFDRKYEYDQIGRLVEAYSGREARGEAPSFPTPDSPYRQTNVYNEFGNRLQQTGRIWQKNLSGNLFSYSNNRRFGLEYDEAGRVVDDLQGVHVFDAQGQRSLVTAGTVGGGATGNPEVPAGESTTVNDGRGLPTAVTATSRSEELVGQGPQTTISTDSETAFYLRSTVLDAVIAELNSEGQRSKEYVYAGGERLVAWTITPWNTSLEWQHKNPITGAWISIFAPSNSALRTEVDPSGRATGNEPFLIPPEPEEPKQTRETFYPIEGAPSINEELGMQLYEDRYINKVFGDQAGPGEGPYVGDNWSRWAEEREFQLMTGQRFLSGIDELNANIPGSFEWEEEYETLDGGESWSQGEDGNWSASTTVISRSLGFRLVPGSGAPQNPASQQPNQTVIGIVNAVFASPKCAEFLKTILNKASTEGNPVLHGGDIAKIFSDFLAQKGGGVTRGSLPGARYGSASGRIQSGGKGNGVIYRGTVATGGDQDEYDASGIVNELPHLAGSKGGWPKRKEYDDLSLARAAYDSGYDKYFRFFTVPNPFSTYPDKKSQQRNRFSNVWSSYFHDILKQHCPVP